MVKFQKINNVVVKPIKVLERKKELPTRGMDLIPKDFANIFVCAKKETGKSTVVFKMVREFAGPDTCVHVFCSTVFIDDLYMDMAEWLDRKGIPFYPSTSMKDDDGFDLVHDILIQDKQWKDMNDKGTNNEDDNEINLLDLDEKAPKPKRKRKSKYRELRRIFIFDDLSNEIRKSKSIKALLKQNRHYHYKTIFSSQWVNDLEPDCISQMDYTLLFKEHNEDKLEELYYKLNLSLSLEQFLKLYDAVTNNKKEFNFLYISRTGEYRRNFDNKYIGD